MATTLTILPSTRALAAGLGRVLRARRIHVLHREANPYASMFPSEVVRYQREDGREGELLCKYMVRLDDDHRDHGCRGGVAYEGMVYDRVLRGLPLTLPAYHGTYRHDATGSVWLVLEYLGDAQEMHQTTDGQAMTKAAAWIGRFHAAQERRLAAAPLSFLSIYDGEFYRGWMRRTQEYAGPWLRRNPWLRELGTRFAEVIALLREGPPTVIHGEYYPPNILVRDEAIYPVDWEAAAVAAGEIDLAAQTEGWPVRVVRECERAYRQARWPAGAPVGFARRLSAARLFLQLRWLGDQPDWSQVGDAAWRLEQLAAAGKRLGLVENASNKGV